MVFSTTGGNRWVLFGLLYKGNFLDRPGVLFCPSENNPKFMFNASANPWPEPDATPTSNIQAGYCARPRSEIPDDPANPPAYLQPFSMPRLTEFRNLAILADLTAARTRVDTRHVDGVNVLYADGSARWLRFTAFCQPDAEWPEPTLPPIATYNGTQDAIWAAFDKE
jgi:prepilin-type processing-associated H-X9-DG protein